MNRAYYSETIKNFKYANNETIIGTMALASNYSDETLQKNAWIEEIRILKDVLADYDGKIYFEYSIPRMGLRVDVILIINHVIFVLEFKIGEKDFTRYAYDQVWDYALDLKNFHETSHDKHIVPILIATKAITTDTILKTSIQNDKLYEPVKSSP